MVFPMQMQVLLLALGLLVAVGLLTIGLILVLRPRTTPVSVSPDDVHTELVKLRREVAAIRGEWTDAQQQLSRLFGRITRAKAWDDPKPAQMTIPTETAAPAKKDAEPPRTRKQLAAEWFGGGIPKEDLQ